MEEKKPYKINIGDVVTIERQDYNGYVFYKIPVSKRTKDGVLNAYKSVRFNTGIELNDKTTIKIKDMFEDFYMANKYNATFTLFISDFEIIKENDYNEISYDPYSFQTNDLYFDETEIK